MMNNKIIACDLDDVLWDLISTWVDEYNKIYKPTFKLEKEYIDSWDFSTVFANKVDIQIFYSILTHHGFWDKVAQNQNSSIISRNKMWLRILNTYFDVYIVTHTAYYQRHKLDLFLDLFKDVVNKDQLVLIKDKWLINADIVIDDRAETLEKFTTKGARCVKINQPWNKWFDCENYDTFSQAAEKLMQEVGYAKS